MIFNAEHPPLPVGLYPGLPQNIIEHMGAQALPVTSAPKYTHRLDFTTSKRLTEEDK